jgi:hypothetical protein
MWWVCLGGKEEERPDSIPGSYPSACVSGDTCVEWALWGLWGSEPWEK